MFPLRDENPTYSASFVTFVIIGINILAWVFIQGLGSPGAVMDSVWSFGLIPGELLGRLEPGTPIQIRADLIYRIQDDPNWKSLITSMFMHGGWLHLVGNMWFLYVFGDNVEDVFGHNKFIIFYLLCAYAVLFPRAPVHMLVFFGFFFTRIVVPAVFMLGYWLILQLLGGLLGSGAGGVAFWAHIGGFIAGIILLKIFCSSERAEICRRKRGRTDKIVRKYRMP
jgi:membrane associated rhomboid family serine protease